MINRKMTITPKGWPCKLRDCSIGLFIFKGHLCLKTAYGVSANMDVFTAEGEAFWGGTAYPEDRAELMVQPVIVTWEEEEVFV